MQLTSPAPLARISKRTNAMNITTQQNLAVARDRVRQIQEVIARYEGMARELGDLGLEDAADQIRHRLINPLEKEQKRIEDEIFSIMMDLANAEGEVHADQTKRLLPAGLANEACEQGAPSHQPERGPMLIALIGLPPELPSDVDELEKFVDNYGGNEELH